MNSDITGEISRWLSLDDIVGAGRVCKLWHESFVIPPAKYITHHNTAIGEEVCVGIYRHDMSVMFIDGYVHMKTTLRITTFPTAYCGFVRVGSLWFQIMSMPYRHRFIYSAIRAIAGEMITELPIFVRLGRDAREKPCAVAVAGPMCNYGIVFTRDGVIFTNPAAAEHTHITAAHD